MGKFGKRSFFEKQLVSRSVDGEGDSDEVAALEAKVWHTNRWALS